MTQTTYTCRYILFSIQYPLDASMHASWRRKSGCILIHLREFWNLEQQKWGGIESMLEEHVLFSCSVDKWNSQLFIIRFFCVCFLVMQPSLCHPVVFAYYYMCVVFSIHSIFTSHFTHGDTIKSSSPSKRKL